MKRLWLSLFFVLAIPFDASARTILVKSGEHQDFSRLVLYAEKSETLSISEVENSVLIRSSNAEDKYDFKTVFEFVPKTRIFEILDLGRGTLSINLNCPCPMTQQTLPTGHLVIDFFDMPDATVASLATAVDMSEPKPTTPPKASLNEARAGLPLNVSSNATSIDQSKISDTSETLTVERPSTYGDSSTNLRASKTDILRSLARASTQGLVEPKSDDSTDSTKNQLNVSPTPTAKYQQPAQEPLGAQSLAQQHITSHTTHDDTLAQIADRLVAQTDTDCPDPALFDISSWGDTENGALDFSAQRPQLYGEFDEIDRDRAVKHIQHLIYLTLGQEALAEISFFDIQEPNRAALVALAEVIETLPVSAPETLDGYLGCESGAAFWAFLALEAPKQAEELDKSKIISTYSALPTHLRKHLGPVLAQKFLDISDVSAAHMVKGILEKTYGPDHQKPTLLDAHLAAEAEKPEQAVQTLEAIVDQSDPSSAEAMIELLNSRVKSGEGVSIRTFEVADSLALEYKDTKTGHDLVFAIAGALFQVGEFEHAYAKLDQAAPPKIDGPTWLKAAAVGATRLTENASDQTFLEITLARENLQNLDEMTRIKLADRLLMLGFPRHAVSLLNLARHAPGKEARVLLAKVANFEGKPDVALSYLAGLEGPNAQAERASAYSIADQHQNSAQIYASLGHAENAANSFVRNQNWAEAAELSVYNSEAIQTLNQGNDEGAGPAAPKSIADFQMLIEKSGDVRGAVNDLLKEFPEP